MSARGRLAFLAVVLAQAAHSVEEYLTRLWEVLAPARFLSGLLTDDLPVGFAIVNAAFVLFGLWCWAALVRPGRPWARPVAWGWAVLELGNAIGHSLFALERGGYYPGVGTAPLLAGTAAWLMLELGRAGRAASGTTPATG